MAIWRRLESWLSWFPWYRRQARDADLARELRDHLDLEADEQRAAGLSPEEAAYAVHRALGDTLRIEEDVRAAWGLQWFETFVLDPSRILGNEIHLGPTASVRSSCLLSADLFEC